MRDHAQPDDLPEDTGETLPGDALAEQPRPPDEALNSLTPVAIQESMLSAIEALAFVSPEPLTVARARDVLSSELLVDGH